MRLGVIVAVLVAVISTAFAHTVWGSFASSKKGVWTAKAIYPIFDKGAPVSDTASAAFRAAAKAYYDDFMTAARQNPQRVSYELIVKPTIAINSAQVISGYYTAFSFTGGAHPNTVFKTITVGMVGGKPKLLTASDILVDGKKDALMALLQTKLVLAKKAKGMGDPDPIDPAYADQFVVTRSGITWMFEPYAVGAYVEGAYLLKCTWSELDGIVNKKGALASLLQQTLSDD